MKKYLQRALPAFILVVLISVLILSDALYYADMLLCDTVYKKLEGQTRDIKIICIDEKTEANFGKMEDWSREKSAQLIELLNADPETAPAVIAFDIMFIGEGDPEQDAQLAAAARNAGNIVLASNLVYTGRMETAADGSLLYNPSVIDKEERPFSALYDASIGTGFANVCISADNIVRYAQLYTDAENERYFSFAYTAYRAYAQEDGAIPDANNGQIGFFYSGEPGDIPHVSLVDVLDGKIPVSEFSDCLVFVGAYASGFQDAYFSSAMRGEQMYGVEINANIVLALLNNKLYTPINTWLYTAVITLLLAAYVYFADKRKLRVIILEAIVLVSIHIIVGRFMALRGIVIPQMPFIVGIIAALLWFIIEKYVVEGIRHRRAVGVLKKYVAPQIVEKLSRDGSFDLHLGGEKRHVAVLFVDVRGFTTLSESLPPEDVVSILNRYLSVTTAAVFKNQGTLDKFVGDATMAVFNAPFDLDDYIFRAVQTAWDIQTGVSALGKTMQSPIHVGVGVNCGEAVVGNIGCEARMDYTAIGDTVNTAARLESNAKAGQILISQAVFDSVGERLITEPLGALKLKGKNEQIPVYNVIGFRE